MNICKSCKSKLTPIYLRDLKEELQSDWIKNFDGLLLDAYTNDKDIIVGYYITKEYVEVSQ